jgi:hypothetical protein
LQVGAASLVPGEDYRILATVASDFLIGRLSPLLAHRLSPMQGFPPLTSNTNLDANPPRAEFPKKPPEDLYGAGISIFL